MNLKLSDITRVRTNKLSDKILSESLIVRKFSILMYKDYGCSFATLLEKDISVNDT